MIYSLINVYRDNGDSVDGTWVEDVIGSLDDALCRARETEKANSNKIHIAVVEQINSPTAILHFWTGLKPFRADSAQKE